MEWNRIYNENIQQFEFKICCDNDIVDEIETICKFMMDRKLKYIKLLTLLKYLIKENEIKVCEDTLIDYPEIEEWLRK